jgi:hypothetical protein
MPVDSGFQLAATMLLREAFDGIPAGQDYTWFVQGKEGVFDALTSIDAETASRKPSPTCASIAAHANHILFILQCANVDQGRPEPEGTWEGTWERQAVTDPAWTSLVESIREEYSLLLGWLEKNTDWSQKDAFVGALVPLPHIAFHLGAIRQILRLVHDQTSQASSAKA